jgi:hypothetical protein
MKLTVNYQLGDKVQAHDGRIGTIIHTEQMVGHLEFPNYQNVVVRFPDLSTMAGPAENFKAVFDWSLDYLEFRLGPICKLAHSVVDKTIN